MGLSASKRVKSRLRNSPEFNSACDSAFNHCLSLTQHAFHGVFPYQLSDASTHIHRSLSSSLSLIHRWVPSPPSQSQIHAALDSVVAAADKSGSDPDVIERGLFNDWAVELFALAVVENAGRAVLTRVPIGVAGIAGIGMVVRPGKELIGSVIGVYALGVAAWVFFSLSG